MPASAPFCSWTASIRRRWSKSSWAIGSMTATTCSTPPKHIARASPGCAGSGEGLLQRDQLGRPAKKPGGRRPLPAAFATRCGGAQAAAQHNRFFKGLVSWIGFRQIRVDYEPEERIHGRTTWNLYSLIGFSIDGLTSFSVAPLRLASLLGLMLATAAFIFGLQILTETFVFREAVPGYPSLVVGLMVLGGVQLIMIGIVDEYIGKILPSSKRVRPILWRAHAQDRRRRGRRQQSAGAVGGRVSGKARREDNVGRRREPRAAPHLAVRRRLRHLGYSQYRDPRSRVARPPQRCVGAGGCGRLT
jgi:hypothetical protein